MEQASALVAFFKDKEIDEIYSSPFRRAIETIKPLALAKNIEIIEDSRLGERILSSVNMEDWQEKLKQSFEDFEPAFEGGESHTSAMERASSILKEILLAHSKHVVLVSHGNLTALLLRYFNESFGYDELMEMSNPDVFEVVVSEEQAMLNRIWDDRI